MGYKGMSMMTLEWLYMWNTRFLRVVRFTINHNQTWFQGHENNTRPNSHYQVWVVLIKSVKLSIFTTSISLDSGQCGTVGCTSYS